MQSSLASQAMIELKSTLKNTEFGVNCSITKPVNLASQSEQAIENSSLTTKYSSKSCHMTDHRQANGKPLNGQQRKKNKKKRKVNLQV